MTLNRLAVISILIKKSSQKNIANKTNENHKPCKIEAAAGISSEEFLGAIFTRQ